MCYCEHKNGRNHSNGIICENHGSFNKTGHCGLDEICIGESNVSNPSNAVYQFKKESLCAKSTLKV